MSTLWDHSNTLEWYAGSPAAGALAYFFVGGTTTPLVVYEDAGESTPQTDPVEADTNGRWPNVFIPYIASYDVRVTTASGTQLYYPRLIPNPDPVSVATGTILTSSSQLFQTGGMRFEVRIDAPPDGWVRANGRTIGSASSGATERANADTLALYTFLFDAAPDAVLPVSGGRAASASATFALNRAIAVPDMRGGFPIGSDAMGNSAAGRFVTATFTNGGATTGASFYGENTHALLTAELAAHTHSTGTLTNASENSHTHGGTTGDENQTHVHSGTTGNESNTHTHLYGSTGIAVTGGSGVLPIGTGAVNTTSANDGGHTHTITTGTESATHTHGFSTNTNSGHTHAISGATASTGSGTAHNTVSVSTLGTWLIKL